MLLERAYEGITVSAGERCLGHQEGEKERAEAGLRKEREPETINAVWAVRVKALRSRNIAPVRKSETHRSRSDWW